MKMKRRAYLTMDTDWASDEVLAFALDWFEANAVPATIFVTHDTPLLARMRANSRIRLGIHPNFYPLLNAKPDRGDYHETVAALKRLVPEAIIARSHGLVDAGIILDEFAAQRCKADSNLFIPFSSGISLQPFAHYSGLTRIPYFYEDDAYCFDAAKPSPEAHLRLDPTGLKVFNFHPIHLFLNTETMERYGSSRPVHGDFARLSAFVNPSARDGAFSFLKRIFAEARELGIEWGLIEELVPGREPGGPDGKENACG